MGALTRAGGLLTFNVKAKFVATEKENDKAPDYLIFQAPHGRKQRGRAIANISRSNSTIRASRHDLRLAGEE
jgi:hypothetical protein